MAFLLLVLTCSGSKDSDFYDVEEDKFCGKQMSEHDKPALSPLPRESGITEYRFDQTSLLSKKPTSPSRLQKDYHSLDRQLPKVKEESTMEPPVPLILRREENIKPRTQKGRNY
ncbi:uncharacterized protein Pyn_25038 [Prunus yedoensis var. nudiflora]|uniref:Uncharacterized protein n=1 Tax=Prunus yedoensis var. nudiflora TaxID=2094558 RepID=A0A314Z0E3_PRUYE|nr:uncharacterized protein Pyn_25038 [Prunus yedoensis var. nudiflora]